MTKISIHNGHLHYTRYGTGDKVLLTFHGFGQDKSQFEGWIDIIGDEYTIYAFDLFYHGLSTRAHGKLSKQEWSDYLNDFLAIEQIDRFSVLGYSLGGRFAISSAIHFRDRLEELILIAPDGIFLTIWFKLATTPSVRWLFKYIINNPDKLENLIHLNEKTKLVNSYVADFVRKEMNASENRKRVYMAWNHFKTLGYTQKELIKNLGQVDYKKRIILGSKDHIIHPTKILPIIDRIGDFKVDILPLKHHQLIGEPSAELIAKSYNE